MSEILLGSLFFTYVDPKNYDQDTRLLVTTEDRSGHPCFVFCYTGRLSADGIDLVCWSFMEDRDVVCKKLGGPESFDTVVQMARLSVGVGMACNTLQVAFEHLKAVESEAKECFGFDDGSLYAPGDVKDVLERTQELLRLVRKC